MLRSALGVLNDGDVILLLLLLLPLPPFPQVLLMGAPPHVLKRVKRVVQLSVFASYHLALETSFLADEGALPPGMLPAPPAPPLQAGPASGSQGPMQRVYSAPDYPAPHVAAQPSASLWKEGFLQSAPAAPGVAAAAATTPAAAPPSGSGNRGGGSQVATAREWVHPMQAGRGMVGAAGQARGEGGGDGVNVGTPASQHVATGGAVKAAQLDASLLPDDAKAGATLKLTAGKPVANGGVTEISQPSRDGPAAATSAPSRAAAVPEGVPAVAALAPPAAAAAPPSEHQTILVWVSSRCVSKKIVCEPPELTRIKYYGERDMPLAHFLRHVVLDPAWVSPVSALAECRLFVGGWVEVGCVVTTLRHCLHS